MSEPSISRFPVPEFDSLPEDIRERILEVQEKAGIHSQRIPRAGSSARRIRAFFAYHDALMEKERRGSARLNAK